MTDRLRARAGMDLSDGYVYLPTRPVAKLKADSREEVAEKWRRLYETNERISREFLARTVKP